MEALLKATHALGSYHLVLKQGEPFRPIVLRVHSDPISIVAMVLEQNQMAYTRLQEFLETGMNMVRAGLPIRNEPRRSSSPIARDLQRDIEVAEKRITALCIDAALREDDFETAYSYVVSRLGAQGSQEPEGSSSRDAVDAWSWMAALKAGQYMRTEKSQQPTHLGTASGNLAIRHLEQRIECLATALRVAPTNQLQEILKSFRRCEEQLDSAVKEEATEEASWESGVTSPGLPGAYDNVITEQRYPARNMMAGSVARQADEAPMSLLDLSRATARAAQRNLTALSALEEATAEMGPASSDIIDQSNQQRVRKRDQLRDAATGTLVSGVGWLIGANPTQG